MPKNESRPNELEGCAILLYHRETVIHPKFFFIMLETGELVSQMDNFVCMKASQIVKDRSGVSSEIVVLWRHVRVTVRVGGQE